LKTVAAFSSHPSDGRGFGARLDVQACAVCAGAWPGKRYLQGWLPAAVV